MSRATPFMKFFPADWRADQCLRIVSLAARGLWIECMCIMHEAAPYGHLLINGRAPTDAQLAALTGTSADQIAELLAELEAVGVFSRTSQGVIYSRRMTKDEKKARTARKNGKNGGNPTLRKQSKNPASDKGPVKGGDNTHIPEARSQIPEGSGGGERASPPLADQHDHADDDPPSPPSPTGTGTGTDDAKRLLAHWQRERRRLWPGNPSMPEPPVTSMATIAGWLREGVPPDLIAEAVTRGLERMAQAGRAPPTTLSYFRRSMADALTAYQNAAKPLPQGDPHHDPAPAAPHRRPQRSGPDRTDERRRALLGAASDLALDLGGPG